MDRVYRTSYTACARHVYDENYEGKSCGENPGIKNICSVTDSALLFKGVCGGKGRGMHRTQIKIHQKYVNLSCRPFLPRPQQFRSGLMCQVLLPFLPSPPHEGTSPVLPPTAPSLWPQKNCAW